MSFEHPPLIVSAPTLAVLLNGISVRRIQQLADEGVLPRMAHGQYDALVCVPAFLRHRAAEAADKAASTPAAERMRELKAQDLELRLEERSGKLSREAEADAVAVVDEIVGPLKSDLYASIARVTKDQVLRNLFTAEFDAAFNAAANRAAAYAKEGRSPARSKRPK